MPLLLGWFLNLVYSVLLACVAPVLAYRRRRSGKTIGGWREKLTGRIQRKDPSRRCLWFHAVSVGEVLQLQRVLEETASRFPEAELLITTTTSTGYDLARRKYSAYTVAYFPFDFTWAVCRALGSIRPDLVVLVELELWPNFILECHRRGIALALINGRIGEKSCRGYSRIKPLIRRVLDSFDLLAVQSVTCSQRLQSLGAPAGRIVVTGNLKFDRVDSDRENPRTAELRRIFGVARDERVFVAGSTQSPEEEFAIRAWQAARVEFPNVRLIVVPRHQERFAEVAELIQQVGLPLFRRSSGAVKFRSADSATTALNGSSTIPCSPVILLDTLGELAACWGLADIAFVGGSLANQRGGQNMIEPAGFGAAVMFGPNTWNFKDVTEALLSQGAARVVHDEEELRQALCELLSNPELANGIGQNAKRFVGSQQGATAHTVDLIANLITKPEISDTTPQAA